MTYTFVTLEVSAGAYDEIRGKLVEADYQHAILPKRHEGHELVDMHGIALLRGHDADCPSRDGFYPENCECSHSKKVDGPINPRGKSRTTRAQRRTQEATRDHKHHCELDWTLDTRVCLGRGYHQCKCGATHGIASTSQWIKAR